MRRKGQRKGAKLGFRFSEGSLSGLEFLDGVRVSGRKSLYDVGAPDGNVRSRNQNRFTGRSVVALQPY